MTSSSSSAEKKFSVSTKDTLFAVMLAFVPLSWVAEQLGWGELAVFVLAGVAIVPLAGWMGTATEAIAVSTGETIGGLLNATFGNATELILAIVALRAGLVEVVKASITGSIIGNLLLVMGLAMLLGGLRHKEQIFQSTVARVNASSMNLAVIALLVPAAMAWTSEELSAGVMAELSEAIAIVLMVVYGFTLLFSMKTHSYLYEAGIATEEGVEVAPAGVESHQTEGGRNLYLWLGILFACTIAVAFESELLVSSLETATEQLGFTALFTGVIVLPIIGNAAEHATAVTVAMKNKMELALAVAVGSTMQIALFVAPLLILIGQAMGQPMDLDFNPFELVAVSVGVLIANSISSDGRSNWLEGALLLSAYAVLGLAFFFHPAIAGL
ncbi:MAG: calcium/proton exchanger [Cyanobacteria bacterium J06642_2]